MARLTDLCEDIIRIILQLLAGPVHPITDGFSVVAAVAGSNFSKASLCAAARAHPIFTWMASQIIFRTIEVYLGKTRPPTVPTKYALREQGLRKLRQVLAAGTDRSRQLQTYIKVIDASWVRDDQEEQVKPLLDMAPNLQNLTLRNPYRPLAYLDFSQMSRLQRANICVPVTCDDVAKLAGLPNLEFLALDQPGWRPIPLTCCQSPKRPPLPYLEYTTSGEESSRKDLRWILEQFHGTKKLCTTLPKSISPHLISEALLPAQAFLEELEIRRWRFWPDDRGFLNLSSFYNLTKLTVCEKCFFCQGVEKNDISSCLPKNLEYLEINFHFKNRMNALNNADPRQESDAIDVLWLLQIAWNKRERCSSLKYVCVRENHDTKPRSAEPWRPPEEIGICEAFELAGIELQVFRYT